MKHKGFTIIELMIVVVIAGIIAAISVPSFIRTARRDYMRKIAIETLTDIRLVRQRCIADPLKALQEGVSYKVIINNNGYRAVFSTMNSRNNTFNNATIVNVHTTDELIPNDEISFDSIGTPLFKKHSTSNFVYMGGVNTIYIINDADNSIGIAVRIDVQSGTVDYSWIP